MFADVFLCVLVAADGIPSAEEYVPSVRTMYASAPSRHLLTTVVVVFEFLSVVVRYSVLGLANVFVVLTMCVNVL